MFRDMNEYTGNFANDGLWIPRVKPKGFAKSKEGCELGQKNKWTEFYGDSSKKDERWPRGLELLDDTDIN